MASKEVIARQAMKELSEAHEAGVRNNYAVWMKKMEQDTESARQHMLSQVKEVSRQHRGPGGQHDRARAAQHGNHAQ